MATVPLDGRMTSFQAVPATLAGDELLWMVQPGNVTDGVLYNITLDTIAAFIAAFPSLNTEIITAGATSGSPFAIQTTDTAILVNKILVADTYLIAPTAASMLYKQPVLIKDAAGNADTYPITISFSGAEKCDNQTTIVINNPYGWVRIVPYPTGGSWYQA